MTTLEAWNKPRRTEIVLSSTSLDEVTAQALQLTPEERAELIERLADTVMPAPPLHPSWEAEIARRVAEMDAGLVVSIPAEQVFVEMRDIIDAEVAERRL